MISLSKLSNPSNVNVNVSTKISAFESKTVDANDSTVKYPDNEQKTVPIETYNEVVNKCEVLKLYISMLRNNPLVYNGYIIADDETFMNFIKLLTDADDVQINADDVGEGCISKNVYRKVHAIYVIKNNETKNLKYDFPGIMKELTDLGISVKFVF